jgi:hypothetical protein
MSKKRIPTEQEIAKKHGVDVDYVVRQAEIGSTVEREHVTDHTAAYGIALQHIAEFPDYYKHLLPMEKNLKKEWENKKPIKENHIDIAMGKMLDDEGSMIINQLDEIERYVQMLRGSITGPDMQVPGWVQSKVTLATDYMNTAANYMSSKNEEVQLDKLSFKEFSEIFEGAAWTKSSGKNKNGGLNEKGRKSYEKENPGSDLKAPSKEVGNSRRSSFCARMKGMKKKLTSKKTASDPDSRINKSLRAWNC